jgi:hypothetical protein
MTNPYLQPDEVVIASAEAKIDVRSPLANNENPAPWADLGKPKHDGSITLTRDRLAIVFNPGNVRVVSVPLRNVLLAWERTAEGRKNYPAQFVFVLPAGMFCVCEVENSDTANIRALRGIVHALVCLGNAGAESGDVQRKKVSNTLGVDLPETE